MTCCDMLFTFSLTPQYTSATAN